ncbi:MAG TPA: anthranilate phosphoribosyltransferase [Bryobacteraceae bacterium]|jgi:anthranilate phosphoribosyltransferase|nr:anthranilate phosphoribosyltransferase [Bryobacteraceae bacterium]
MASFVPYLHRAAAGESLSAEDAQAAMNALLSGDATAAQIAGFAIAIKMKGETAAELTGFARALREHMIVVDAGDDLIDTCGTGGDLSGTFNISTVAAFVMAGAGARVAKHGGRSATSQTGSADVLEALGVRISMTPEEAAGAIREIGIGFLFAPNLHPAMKHAAPVRRELRLRTVFNLIGPLANPARAATQLIGTPSPEAAKLIAEALAALGTGHSFVVHGHDGLDEITTTGPTDVYEVWTGRVVKHLWTPADFGVKRAFGETLLGGDAQRNAEIARDILAGVRGPMRDIVLLNAAAGLFALDLAKDLRSAVLLAEKSIDSGAATDKLQALQKKFPFS